MKSRAHKSSKKTARLDKVIRSIIAKIIEVDERKIGPTTDFVKGLDMSSMTALEILAAIEKRYNIEIPEENLPQIRNLNDTVKLAKKLLS